MEKRKRAVRIAFAFLGKPYYWGGDDPMQGFDCSGFVQEVLRSMGKLADKVDLSAAALAAHFTAVPYEDVDFCIEPGDLVFWKNLANSKIEHVEMCVDSDFSIGASGGGSSTLSTADAIKQNAYIKIRPFKERPGSRVLYVAKVLY